MVVVVIVEVVDNSLWELDINYLGVIVLIMKILVEGDVFNFVIMLLVLEIDLSEYFIYCYGF